MYTLRGWLTDKGWHVLAWRETPLHLRIEAHAVSPAGVCWFFTGTAEQVMAWQTEGGHAVQKGWSIA